MATYLPWLIFLACPLMMIFMMKGMSHGGDADSPMTRSAGDADLRIAELEHELAALKSGRVRLDKNDADEQGRRS